MGFMERAAEVEPPPELMTRLLFQAPWAQCQDRHHGREELVPQGAAPGFAAALRHGNGDDDSVVRHAGAVRDAGAPVAPGGSGAGAGLGRLEDRVYRSWQRTVKFYESLKVVYQIQSKLHEWQQQQEEEPKPAADTDKSGRTPDTHRLPDKPGGESALKSGDNVMNCFNHSETPAVAYCRACGKALCTECKRTAQGTIFCDEHAPAAAIEGAIRQAVVDRMAQKKPPRPAPPRPPRVPPRRATSRRASPACWASFPEWAPFTTANMPRGWCMRSSSDCWFRSPARARRATWSRCSAS